MGAVYFAASLTDNPVRTLEENIIIETGMTNPNTPTLVRGLYLDGGADYTDVKNNVVAYTLDDGIMNGGGDHVLISGNLMFANNCQLFLQDYYGMNGWPHINTNTVTGNKCISKAGQYAYKIYVLNAYIAGTFTQSDNNYFARPIDDDYVVRKSETTTELTLAQWKTFSGLDTNSAGTPVTITSDDDMHLIYNNTNAQKTWTLSAAMKDVDGTDYSSNVTLNPWTGKVLIGAGTIEEGEIVIGLLSRMLKYSVI
jgi:hypothetical protein